MAPNNNVLQALTPFLLSNARTSQSTDKKKSPSARLSVKSAPKNHTSVAHESQSLAAALCTPETWAPLQDCSSSSSSSLTVCCRDAIPNFLCAPSIDLITCTSDSMKFPNSSSTNTILLTTMLTGWLIYKSTKDAKVCSKVASSPIISPPPDFISLHPRNSQSP